MLFCLQLSDHDYVCLIQKMAAGPRARACLADGDRPTIDPHAHPLLLLLAVPKRERVMVLLPHGLLLLAAASVCQAYIPGAQLLRPSAAPCRTSPLPLLLFQMG